MSTFISYSSNTTAQLQLSLIKSALALADYRIVRVKDKTSWQIWHKFQRKSQGVCVLSYNGWGKGVGKWWNLTGAAPQKVLNVIATCLDGDRYVQKENHG